MLSLTYVSSATKPFSEGDLVALLAHSREHNARRNITGMLLYKDGNFMQVLEGREEPVRKLFERIHEDVRHRGVILLLEQQIERHEFPDWSMAFRNLSDPALREVPGYSEFMNQPLDSEMFRTDQNRARRLIEVFRRNLAR